MAKPPIQVGYTQGRIHGDKKVHLQSVPDIGAWKSPDLDIEAALTTLLEFYVRRKDWFMAERLTHDLHRLETEPDFATPTSPKGRDTAS